MLACSSCLWDRLSPVTSNSSFEFQWTSTLWCCTSSFYHQDSRCPSRIEASYSKAHRHSFTFVWCSPSLDFPTLRRVLYSTSSIKSTSTSTVAPPPAGVPFHQRKRTSSRVGEYLPRRALPTISDTLRTSLMMQTEMELNEIGTKQAVSQGLRSKSLGQRVFDFLAARYLSMARKQLPPKLISVIYSVFGMVAITIVKRFAFRYHV